MTNTEILFGRIEGSFNGPSHPLITALHATEFISEILMEDTDLNNLALDDIESHLTDIRNKLETEMNSRLRECDRNRAVAKTKADAEAAAAREEANEAEALAERRAKFKEAKEDEAVEAEALKDTEAVRERLECAHAEEREV
jgi:hypothetical protein